ncbi:MAG: nickel-transporting ATPase [Oscillospiraceae bacterium]|nr:nickel-transporting ATPase [Oscillospiraceae bacterium]
MTKYIFRRILMLIPVLIGVVVIIFTINFFSKVSPAVLLVGANATPELLAAKEAELGIDRPYLVQLASYFWNIIAHGTLGTSYVYRQPVWDLISVRLLVTIKIGFCAAMFSAIIGIPLGILAAVKQNSIFDYASTIVAIVMAALPSFWVCLMLMLFFGMQLKVVPISGLPNWKGYLMPIIATGMMPVAMTMRMTRSSMLEVIRQDYIRTARAKGLKESTVIFKHALKNALIPVLTVVGMNLGLSMTGSVISETIFNIPGLGLLMNNSIAQKDFITTQGCVLVAAIIVCVMNLVTDLAYAFVDPRIKAQYSSGRRPPKKSGKEAAA